MLKLYDTEICIFRLSPFLSAALTEKPFTTLWPLLGRQDYPAIEVWVVAAVPAHSALNVPVDGMDIHLVPTDVALARSRAANKALSLARGEFALILDDDDWIAPDHISTLVKALKATPGFDVAYSRTQAVDQDLVAENMPLMGLPFDAMRLLAGNWMPLHSVLFSIRLRDLGCRFDEQLDLYEDWDFWLQAAQQT